MSKFKVGEVVYWKGDGDAEHPMTVSNIHICGVDVTYFLDGVFLERTFAKEELSHPVG